MGARKGLGFGWKGGAKRIEITLHCLTNNNDSLSAFSDAYRIQLTPSDSVSVPPLIQQYV